MPYRFEWDNTNNILLSFYSGVLTMDEVRKTYLDAEPYYDNSTGLVHNIIHMKDGDFSTKINMKDLMNIPEGTRYAEKYRERIGWSVYIGMRDNPFYQMVTAIRMQNANLRMRWFDEMEEAYTFLHENGMIESPDIPADVKSKM